MNDNLSTPAERLLSLVLCGQMVTRQDGQGRDCSLWQQSGEFVMVKQGGGSHAISNDPSITSAERLLAHWDGFCGTQAGSQVEPATEPRTRLIASDNDVLLPVGSSVTIFRNQAERDGEILAVLGDEALVSYEMPSGVTYLNIVAADGSDEPGAYRAVSVKALPAKWRKAILEQYVPAYGRPWVSVRTSGGIFGVQIALEA